MNRRAQWLGGVLVVATIALLVACIEDRVATEATNTATAGTADAREGPERCAMPPHVTVPASGVALGDASKAFCVVWAGGFPDATAFRISVRYEGGERFTHEVAPSEREFVFPPSEAPILSGPECTARRSYTVEVFVVRANGDEPVGAAAVSVECGSHP
jgi:hypothetical protein